MQVSAASLFLASCAALLVLLPVAMGFESLPPTALPTVSPDPQKGYAIVNQGQGVYLLTDGAYWSMAVVSRSGAHGDDDDNGNDYGRGSNRKTLCVVDQPVGFYTNVTFLAAIREVLTLSGASTVSDIVYSHQHADHIGNAGWLKRAYPRAVIHAHAEVKRRLVDRKDSNRPIPNMAYDGNFTLGNFGLSLYDFGDAHTPGNLAIYHRSSKVLMVVDVIFPGWTAFRDLAQAEYTPSFLQAPRRVLQFDFNVLVGGHLTRLGTRADVEVQIAYFDDIVANAQNALATVSSFPIAARLGTFDPTSPNFLNYWALFEQYLSEVDQACFRDTMRVWSGRLGGVDVFTLSHCSRIVESLRID